MKGIIRLAALGMTLSLILAACASQLGTPDNSSSSPESPPLSSPDVPDTSNTRGSGSGTDDTESATSNQSESDTTPRESRDYQIITLLPPDAIPSIDDPIFLSAEEADKEYAPDEEVLGVFFDGEARAYSVPLLSSHEIVNDTVAGRKIAVTW